MVMKKAYCKPQIATIEAELCDMLALSLADGIANDSDALSRDDIHLPFDQEDDE